MRALVPRRGVATHAPDPAQLIRRQLLAGSFPASDAGHLAGLRRDQRVHHAAAATWAAELVPEMDLDWGAHSWGHPEV